MTNGYNFTERVRKVLGMAREEAARMDHEYVGTGHLLLGLLREGEGVGAAVLQNLNANLDDLTQNLEDALRETMAVQATGPDLPYSSRAKKVLELCMSEAADLNHRYVGTEHLLLGLLREQSDVAARILGEAGIHVDAVRAETLRLLGTDSPSGAKDAFRSNVVSVGLQVHLANGSVKAAQFSNVLAAIHFLSEQDQDEGLPAPGDGPTDTA